MCNEKGYPVSVVCENCDEIIRFNYNDDMSICPHCGYGHGALAAYNLRRKNMSDLFPDPDAPMQTLPNGAKQSATEYRYDLLDPWAMAQLANVLHKGAEKYGANNWHGIPVESSLNHAVAHIYAYLAGDTREPHLAHAFTRLMFALAKSSNPNIKGDPMQNNGAFVSGLSFRNDKIENQVPPPHSNIWQGQERETRDLG